MSLTGTSSPSQQRYQAYRNALLRNNLAVSLLEKRSYLHALECLRDGVQTMLTVIYDGSPEAPHQHQHSVIDESLQVQRFYQYLLQQHTVPTLAAPIETVFFEDSIIPFSCHYDKMPNSGSLVHLQATRIEPPQFTQDTCLAEKDMLLHLALMLHNFGLSTYLLTTVTREGYSNVKLLENAHSIFSLATSTIADLINSCGNLIDEVRYLSVAALITGNVFQIHELAKQTGQHHTSFLTENKYWERYCTIRAALKQIQMTEWLTSMEASCASPAA